MAENLLTVAALRSTGEADLIRGKLEAAGIPAVLSEPEKGADGAPAGRVQVQVSPPDFERAMQLLFPIPKAKPAARPAPPAWKCPKCGEQVMGQFPACWSCGTMREGAAPKIAPAPGPASLGTPAAGAAPAVRAPRTFPMPPPPTVAPAPPPGAPARAAAAPAASPMPPLTLPPLPPVGPAVNAPSMNGGSATKVAPPLPARVPRSTEDEDLKIVVPAWGGASTAGAGQSKGRKGSATDYDDRAARRAWWTAVLGIPCPPLLIYSLGVVLLLGLSNRPLSARGNRFFYGALAMNALIIAGYFAVLGMRQ
ncbi:MAG TPA: hypothetical protein VHC22_11675 [Pirellulales bacterium]|nr:hypothetical protein [Pirellulales bacterium]